MKIYKYADLFAGIGGIRLGFEQSFGKQIKTVFTCEWNEAAKKTYYANFNDDFDIVGDITKVNETDVPEFDICSAGFPCVAFSQAGKRLGFKDLYKGQSRGILFMDVVRICEVHRPKVIFCENVKNLVDHDKGHTFKVIKEAFETIGYKLFYKVLNSKDFGVPQNRQRIYIVCFRNDIAPDVFNFPDGNYKDKKIRDILEESPIPSKYYLSDTYIQSLIKHKERHKEKGHGFGYIIRDLDDISGALVCGGMGIEGNLIIDHREHSMIPTTHIKGKINSDDIRKLTPREWARLQSFPDTYKFVVSDTELYKQFGNTVTVNVIKAIADEVKKVLLEVDT